MVVEAILLYVWGALGVSRCYGYTGLRWKFIEQFRLPFLRLLDYSE